MDADKIKQQFANYLPNWGFICAVIVYRLINPMKETILLYPSDGCWVGNNLTTGKKRYYPYKRAAVQIISQNQKNILNKYTHHGIVEVEHGDTVLDIGAFVGEFSLEIHEIADKVYCCEPSPRSVHCIQKNTQEMTNITTISTLISDHDEFRTLKLGEDPTDNSILDIDEGGTVGEVTIYSMTVNRLMKELDVNQIDFLKIDAEGAEPEVIKEIGNSNINKLSIDCGAERFGETTVDEVLQLLDEYGYETYVEKDHVFAKKDI